MVARPKIDRQVMRAHNREVVLDVVRRSGPVARTEVAQHRAVLAELGAPLAAESYGTPTPRRGVMRI